MRVTMVDTSQPEHTGWGFPANARKAHYFAGGSFSACGRWLFAGPVTPDYGKPSPDDCVPCRRWLNSQPPKAGAS